MTRRPRPSEAALLALLGVVVAVVLTGTVVVRIHSSTASDAPTQTHKGQIVTSLDVRDFRTIEATGTWRIELNRGDSWQVELSFPDNLKHFAQFEVRGEQLRLDFDPSPFHDSPVPAATARIVMPALDQLSVKGYSKIRMRNFKGQSLDVDIRGNVTLDGYAGRYDDLDLATTGYNRVDFRGIEVRNANVGIVGYSNIVLHMRGGTLSGSLRGAGTLNYHGQVVEESIRVAGVARVRHLD